jgi:2-oxoglutarate dehydrogenase E1 component
MGLEEGGDDDRLPLPVAGERPHGGGRPTLEGDGEAPGDSVLPILIHGDAAFIGQGIAAETLNLSRLRAYETGGTIHVIANNQLGFTTRPEDGRSTRYASDLALAFRIPVVHVNADDPEACLAAVRMAVDYRSEFGEDIVVDLVGYRRYGHNEGDEPGYTQPAMYEAIDEHPTVRTQLARRLTDEGVLSEEETEGMADRVADELREVQEEVKSGGGPTREELPPGTPQGNGLTAVQDRREVDTTVDRERLLELNQAIHSHPEDFQLFQKLESQLQKRRTGFQEEGEMDWAFAEALAFGSLVTDGVPVRLSGEDTERGTFSQRHLVLHDTERRQTYTPLNHLSDDQAPFQIWNSPLSEAATIGFEYGYSTIAIDSLVLWEAQFGDFVNVGQAVLDQFVVSGRTKWGQESRLTLLLPHGYEGQGPEHSSGRPERFLQLAAEENIRVANCSTPAQYFHLLRLQALREDRRPLVIFTPKSLLRHPRARSRAEELAAGGFQPVLPDPERSGSEGGGGDAVRRAVLCTGKVYYDLVTSDLREEADDVALIRVERAYPFPEEELAEALADHPELEEVAWVQEEPENMGWWSFLRPRLRELLAGRDDGIPLEYVGRSAMASPAEGFASAHAEEQERIVREALTGE